MSNLPGDYPSEGASSNESYLRSALNVLRAENNKLKAENAALQEAYAVLQAEYKALWACVGRRPTHEKDTHKVGHR